MKQIKKYGIWGLGCFCNCEELLQPPVGATETLIIHSIGGKKITQILSSGKMR